MKYPSTRTRSQRAIKLSLAILVVFLVVEALGGYFTNSLALLSDAAHLLTDIGALLLALGAFWFAGQPAHESLNVRGAFVHVATDALQSVAVIITAILILFLGWLVLDPLVSLLIAVLIFWSGGRIAWAALHILLEGAPQNMDMNSLKAALEGVEGVEDIHDLHVWTITSGYNAMSAHAKLQRKMGSEAAQSVLSILRYLSSEKFGIEHVTIQIEGEDMACTEDHASI